MPKPIENLKKKKLKRVNLYQKTFWVRVLRSFSGDDKAVKCALVLLPFFILTAAVLILFLKYEIRLPKEGFPAEKSYYALNDFHYVDPNLTKIEMQKAQREVWPIYEFSSELSAEFSGKTRMIFEALMIENAGAAVDAAVELLSWPGARGVYNRFYDKAMEKERVLEESEIIIRRYLDRYLMKSEDYDALELESEGYPHISLLKAGQEKSVRLSNILKDIYVIDGDKLRKGLREDISYFLPDEKDIRYFLLEIYVHILSKPNLKYNAELTDRQRKGRADLHKDVEKLVKKGSRILEKGNIVNSVHLIKLKAMGRDVVRKSNNPRIFSLLFLLLLNFLLLSFFMVVFCPGKDIFTTEFMLTAGIVYFMACMGIKVSYYLPPFVLVIPLLLPLMFFSILGESLFGLLFSFVIFLNVPVIYAPVNVQLPPYLVGTLFSVIFIRDITRRSQLLRAGVFSGLVYFVAFFVYSVIFETQDIFEAAKVGGTMAIGGFLASILVIGILPVFEHVFHLATNMHLLELSDLNHPLLRRLMREAPGTYHHSLMVGSIAEAAANRIGANTMLSRVGAYYHDIGKMASASYFTENQTADHTGRHDKLTPSMSSLIVFAHIKDGLEIGKKYKLSKKILDIIQQHHGTSIVTYFYQKALEKKPQSQKDVDEYSYRYPGPKPQSKEAAIMMLADAGEAASRTLDDPTPSRIKGLVKRIVDEKIMDHQLDQSNLTFRDVSAITESIIASLNGMFHFRVEYPHDQKNKGPNNNVNGKNNQQAKESKNI